MAIDVPLLCAGLILFGILAYVVLDGFDLGVGILFPWARGKADRDEMMHSISPLWDGNETWLIYGGGVLFAAFPLAYGILLPALYIPLMLMLLALIFRGVSFEFRMSAERSRPIWNWTFAIGSTVAAFMQGIILGTVINGIEMTGSAYTGGTLDWFNRFSITAGIAVVFAYALLGATWLNMKTKGETQAWSKTIAKPLLLLTLLFAIIISIKTPWQYGDIAQRWLSTPNIFFLMPLPILALMLIGFLWHGLTSPYDKRPFFCAVGIFLLCYIGLIVSIFPYIAFPHITIWEAASHPSSQILVLIVACFSLPIIIGYTLYVYYVFRGKVD